MCSQKKRLCPRCSTIKSVFSSVEISPKHMEQFFFLLASEFRSRPMVALSPEASKLAIKASHPTLEQDFLVYPHWNKSRQPFSSLYLRHYSF